MTRRRRGAADQRARRALEPSVAAGLAVCRRCKLPILPGQEWDAGHVEDLGRGGHPAGRVEPEHARKVDCPEGGNRAAGGKLAAELRRARRARRRLDAWLE